MGLLFSLTIFASGQNDQSSNQARPELISECVQKLVELQEEGGMWPYEGRYRLEGKIPVPYEVGGTSLVCMALLYSAEAENGAAQKAFRDGLIFVLGRLDHPQMKSEVVLGYDMRVMGQAYALLMLCHVRAQKAAGDQEALVDQAISDLAAALVHEQMKDGGWNYQGRPVHASFVTASVVQALLWARTEGAKIPGKVFTRARSALATSRLGDGAFFYFGTKKSSQGRQPQDLLPGSVARAPICETMLYLLGEGSVGKIRKSIGAFHTHWDQLEMRRQQTGTHEGRYLIAPYYFYYGHRYAAQAIELLPESVRPKERQRMRALILRTRDEDGTWNDREFPRSRNYSTAMALLTLQSEKIPLPPPRK